MSDYIERYWRDATPQDAIAEPPMVARFRDEDDKEWLIGKLLGFDRSKTFKWCGETRDTINCQVYDAPDPGEGWRLIDTENENGEVGDEFLFQSGVWVLECRHNGFEHGVPYRRRIEPPKPKYIPFTWEDREQLRGRWITREKDGYVIEEIAYRFDIGEFEVVAKNLLQDWRFLDTGEPVGKKVTQ